MTAVEQMSEVHPPIRPPDAPRDPEAELIAFVAGRSVPCPRCGYDLRDIQTCTCPECAEPLTLKVGSPRARFGWLVVAMAPGCFSGVAALFFLVPIWMTLRQPHAPGRGTPWPVMVADAFGFASAASVLLMYLARQRIMEWPARRQGGLAGAVWGAHVLMFVLVLLALFYFK
jgi:hypothetical protein